MPRFQGGACGVDIEPGHGLQPRGPGARGPGGGPHHRERTSAMRRAGRAATRRAAVATRRTGIRSGSWCAAALAGSAPPSWPPRSSPAAGRAIGPVRERGRPGADGRRARAAQQRAHGAGGRVGHRRPLRGPRDGWPPLDLPSGRRTAAGRRRDGQRRRMVVGERREGGARAADERGPRGHGRRHERCGLDGLLRPAVLGPPEPRAPPGCRTLGASEPSPRPSSTRRSRGASSTASSRSGRTSRSPASRSTAGTTGRSGSATSSRSGSRAARGTPGRSRRSSGGCRCWPRRSRCRSRPRWPRARRTPASRTRGRSTAGSTATSRAMRRSPTCRSSRATSPASCARSAAPTRRTGPAPAQHNFHRGGPLTTYAQETHDAIAALGAEIPRDAVERVWEDAMRTTWDRDPVWFHGDVAVNNLLVRDGRLGAILDFGSSGVGDPACDVVIAWTFLSGAAPRPVPRRPRRGRRHVVARPRVGAVEGAHHARRLPRAGLAAARPCRGATSARCWPTTTRTGDSDESPARMRWRRRELNPRPQSRQRWCLRA